MVADRDGPLKDFYVKTLYHVMDELSVILSWRLLKAQVR